VPQDVAARARGASVEVYVEELLSRRAGSASDEHLGTASAAIDRIRELRKGNKRTGLRTTDLIEDRDIFRQNEYGLGALKI
jgi:hypothetical protein